MIDPPTTAPVAAPIEVLVVDDQALIRSAVRQIVGNEPGFAVVGEAVDGRQAVELAQQLRPDVVLMDIRMPGLDGLAATRQIVADKSLTATKVLILTTFEEDDYVLEALRSGASGFIGKGTDPADLIRAVQTVHTGDALLSPLATRSLIDRYVRHAAAEHDGDGATHSARALTAALDLLTDREREILVLVAGGLSNDDIAARLVISPLTAKTHVNRTMFKLGAHDRAQLVIAAYESGLVVPRFAL